MRQRELTGAPPAIVGIMPLLVVLVVATLARPAAADTAQGVALFRAGRPHEASVALAEVTRDPEAGGEERARARYYLARCLNELGLRQSAQRTLLDLLAVGPDAPYAEHALPGLLAIARETGDPSALLSVVDTLAVEVHPPRVQTSLLYLRGLGAWLQGEHPRANDLLAEVPEDSDLFPRARYLQGSMLLLQGKNKSALDAFRDVVAARSRSGDPREEGQLVELRALATLQIARSYEAIAQPERAEHFYALVPQGGRTGRTALVAHARIDLAQGDARGALSRSLAAAATSPDGAPPSEAELLHVQALIALCRGEEARAVLRSLEQRTLPVWTEMARFTAAHRIEDGRWEDTTAAWGAYFEDFPPGSVLSSGVFELLLDDPDFAALTRRERRIRDELLLLDSQDEAWRVAVGEEPRTRLAAELAETRAQAGARLLAGMAAMEGELGQLLTLAEDLRASVARLEEEGCEPAPADSPPSAGDDAWDDVWEPTHFSWPFNGEIWADELGESSP